MLLRTLSPIASLPIATTRPIPRTSTTTERTDRANATEIPPQTLQHPAAPWWFDAQLW